MKLIIWPGKLGRWGFFGRFFLAVGMTILVILPFKAHAATFSVFAPFLMTCFLVDPVLARSRDIGFQGWALFAPLWLLLLGTGIQLAFPAYKDKGSLLEAIVLVVIWRIYPDAVSMTQNVGKNARALWRKIALTKED